MAARVSQNDFEEKVIKSDKPVLLDFYSDVCIPCKRLAGPLGDVEEEYEDKIHVYKVNIVYEEELTEQYKVMSVPTLVLIANGEEKSRRTGAASKEDIIKFLEDSGI